MRCSMTRGASLADHVTLHPIDLLARHAWSSTATTGPFRQCRPLSRRDRCVRRTGRGRRLPGVLPARARQSTKRWRGRSSAPRVPRALSLAAASGLSANAGRLALLHLVEGSRRAFSRPAAAPVVWPLCDLQRIIAIPGTCHADADRACRTAGRLAGRRWHGAAGAGFVRTGGAIRRGRPDRRAGNGNHHR